VVRRCPAQQVRLHLPDLALVGFPFQPLADRVWALRPGATACDAASVALAEALDVPMCTLDRRLAAAPGPRCSFRLPQR